jgi:hypothetical protein
MKNASPPQRSLKTRSPAQRLRQFLPGLSFMTFGFGAAVK